MADGFNPTAIRARHAQVALGIVEGLTNKAIALRIGVSESRVAFLVRQLLWLLDAKSRSGVAAWASVNGEYLNRIIINQRQKEAERDARKAQRSRAAAERRAAKDREQQSRGRSGTAPGRA